MTENDYSKCDVLINVRYDKLFLLKFLIHSFLFVSHLKRMLG